MSSLQTNKSTSTVARTVAYAFTACPPITRYFSPSCWALAWIILTGNTRRHLMQAAPSSPWKSARALVRPDHIQDRFAQVCRPLSTHIPNRGKFRLGTWKPAGDFAQRRVVQNHKPRDTSFFSDPPPQLAQFVEKHFVVWF